VFGNRIGLIGHDPFFGDVVWPVLGNLRGIHIRDGAHGNVIGELGEDVVQELFPMFERITRSRNLIANSSEAGIRLESGCDPAKITPQGVPSGCNVVQNNTLGLPAAGFMPAVGNRVGVLLRPGARANRIGGVNPGEKNTIRGSSKAGIHLDGVQVPFPNQANRILGNDIIGHAGLPVPADPLLAAPLDGIGILADNGTSGAVIGGEQPGSGNRITGTRVGVWLDFVSDVQVRSNRIGTSALPPAGAFADGNEIAILRGCARCMLGPGNEIQANARLALGLAKLGGVVISGGSLNRVVGNWIGADPAEQTLLGNDPWGVLVIDSANNEIGGAADSDGNVIVASVADGVRIEGAQATGNALGRNRIGTLRRGGPLAANLAAGVSVLGGARDNRIGAPMALAVQNGVVGAPARNAIAGNAGGGVVVHGAGSQGNTVRYNSIWAHPGPGIDNQLGGNAELTLLPPVVTSVAGGLVRGTVVPAVPDGSIVQVFSDSADEGQTYVAQGPTDGGEFLIDITAHGHLLLPGGRLNATVTHAVSGSTSEFSMPVEIEPAGLFLQLDSSVSIDPLASPGAPELPVLPIRVSAVGLPVRVLSLRFDATGTLDDAAQVVSLRLFHDKDRDGEISTGDVQLGGPESYPADDGQATLELTGALLAPDSAQTWLLVYSLGPGAPAGSTLAAQITDAAAVSAEAGLGSGGPVVASGLFPIVSPPVTVESPDRDGDRLPDDVDNCPFFASLDRSDSDGDGRGNLCECSDQNGDGHNTVSDLLAINVAIFNPGLATPFCDGNNDGECDVRDISAANVELFSPGTSICERQPVPRP
jgi:hypothetical protein